MTALAGDSKVARYYVSKARQYLSKRTEYLNLKKESETRKLTDWELDTVRLFENMKVPSSVDLPQPERFFS